MKYTKKQQQTRHIRDVVLAIGIACIISGLGTTSSAAELLGRTDLSGGGAVATRYDIEDGLFIETLHGSAGSDTATSAGLIALGSLLFFLSFGLHALTRSPHDRRVPVRKAPSYKSTPLHRKRRTREVIWIEKVIRL